MRSRLIDPSFLVDEGALPASSSDTDGRTREAWWNDGMPPSVSDSGPPHRLRLVFGNGDKQIGILLSPRPAH